MYKDILEKIKWYIYLPVIALSVSLYFILPTNTLTQLMVTMSLLSFAISINCNKAFIISSISKVSLEFYLSHMLVFRIIEKFGLNTLWGNGWLQFIITVLMVFVGTMAFSLCSNAIIDKLQVIIMKKRHSNLSNNNLTN